MIPSDPTLAINGGKAVFADKELNSYVPAWPTPHPETEEKLLEIYRSGQWGPVAIPVPQLSAGLTPNTGVIPFTNVNVNAALKNYALISAKDLQVFPNTVTDQELVMIPLSELPSQRSKTEEFDTPAQNL